MDDFSRKLVVNRLSDTESLLKHPSFWYYIQTYTKERVENKLKETINEFLDHIDTETPEYFDIDHIILSTINRLSKDFTPGLRSVINATGIVVNQNLGRAPLSKEAISHIASTATGYCNLDFDLSKGTSDSRFKHLQKLVKQVTGADDAIIVNNNAAALLLIASTFAKDKEIIISRGEIIEIENEFRLPEIIKAASSKLVEIGTSNKSHLKDYSEAINDKTSMIMKVHTSNYYIKGQTGKVELFALVELARNKGILCIEDLGTGLLVGLRAYGLPHEPTVKDRLQTGVDLISFSGDKLLGGPQAGIIAGKKKYIETLSQNPILRCLRPDKLTLSALEATLQFYLNPDQAIERIPVLKMLTKPIKEIESEAQMIFEELKAFYNVECEIKKSFQLPGESILPETRLPAYIVTIRHNSLDVCTLHKKLLEKGVITLIKDDKITIDPRCLLKRDFKFLSVIFEQVLG
jgi:L-seryl-tRNA(Ser) seleniumtransferase